MAKKITELGELAAQPAAGDLIVIEDVSASTTKKITWDNLIADGSVTPAKRSGGFDIVTLTIPGSTGEVTVSGLDFEPKIVRFDWGREDTGGGPGGLSVGVAMSAAKQYVHYVSARPESSSPGYQSDTRNDACVYMRSFDASGGSALHLVATFVTMTSDGFTVDFTNVGSPGEDITCTVQA